MEVKRCRRAYRATFLPAVNWLLLPQEILIKIFLFLSPNDKLSIRATCCLFKIVIEHHTLWKKSTFLFKDLGILNFKFLEMLKTRKVCSVEVHKLPLYNWKRFIASLPDLVNITLHSRLMGESVKAMRPLGNLQRLQLANCAGLKDHEFIIDVCNFQQLTHLWLCKLTLNCTHALLALVQLKLLRSLSIHFQNGLLPKEEFRAVLFHLPKLRELSLMVHNMTNHCMSYCFSKPEICEEHPRECDCVPRLQLQKLEFIQPSFTNLSPGAFDQLSTLTTICLQHYKVTTPESNLVTLLVRNLPNVTDLKLAWSSLYCLVVVPLAWEHLLPGHLETLSLFGMHIRNDCFTVLLSTTRKLKHLDLSFCHGFDQRMLKCIPKAFPRLTKLYLSNLMLTDDTLLTLGHLMHLEELDISNKQLLTPEGILYFRKTTKDRVLLILERPATIPECQIFFTLYD
ncbi:uncharacterized protein [Ambystoma mexicanum]|uniref:uncharacterized protein n=1 Tax=Ambystoma mexicanum TaxID=8296 RepID=UPI0037E94B96